MNEFDKNWIAYPQKLHDARNESIIITQLTRARRIVFIAKGRVGLATKMFMQRLSQMGYKVAHSEDLLIPEIDVLIPTLICSVYVPIPAGEIISPSSFSSYPSCCKSIVKYPIVVGPIVNDHIEL